MGMYNILRRTFYKHVRKISNYGLLLFILIVYLKGTESEPGIIPQAVENVFRCIEQVRNLSPSP